MDVMGVISITYEMIHIMDEISGKLDTPLDDAILHILVTSRYDKVPGHSRI